MQPLSYENLRAEYGCHVVFVTPCYEFADAIMSLAVMYARHCACCRVPSCYLNDRKLYPARDAWLRQLQDQGRLLVIYPAVPENGEILAAGCVWIMVFASAALQRLMTQRD